MQISGNIVDVINNKIFPGIITIEDSKIVDIAKTNQAVENYILPGLIDAHFHIESSMLTPSRWAQAAAPFGTVGVVADCHEIANVLGLAGIDYMIADTKTVPLKIFYAAPSCVPATSFETSGAVIGASEIKEILQKPEVVALGEVMNFPAVINNDPEMMAKIKVAQDLGKPIDGHCPGLVGDDLAKYVATGITTDHESTNLAEAQEKIRAGLKIMIRQGSAAKNLKALIELVRAGYEDGFFVSDDLHPDDLIKGHLDLILKMAVGLGVEPLIAIKMVSLNPVRHYHLPVGLLQLGDDADLVMVNNLTDFQVLKTYINGTLVAEEGRALFEAKPLEIGAGFKVTAKQAQDLAILANQPVGARVIKVLPDQIITEKAEAQLAGQNNQVQPDLKTDILKIVNCSRYGNNNVGVGFISGFGLKKGAIATSVAHDSHNILAVGVDDQSLTQVINAVVEMPGGLAVTDGQKLTKLALPVAGLMSTEAVTAVVEKLEILNQQVKALGCQLPAPFITLSFMALLVIPKLKLSDQGLFDSENFKLVDLLVKKSPEVLIEQSEIQQLVQKLADQLNQDYQSQEVLLVGILKGSIVFMADLIRWLKMPLKIDFVQLASYQGTDSKGQVTLKKDLDFEIVGREVLIVEDIIDTGLTLSWLKKELLKRQPKSLKVVTLLDKPSRRKVEFAADYVGKVVPDKFVIGYGLDYNEKYRNLPYVGVYQELTNKPMRENKFKIGIIGGTGLEDPQILEDWQERAVETPFGRPSSKLLKGKIKGQEVVIISRHGKGHSIMPTKVPFRANLWALKEQGVTHVLATTACGSLREEYKPGDLVFIDQFIDNTKHRPLTFYEDKVIHTPMAEPFCKDLRQLLSEAAIKLGLNFHDHGTMITIEGPRFSSKAESKMFQKLGADVVNMSTVPEVTLARELGLPYQTVAMVTDYDCWKETEAPVTWEMIVARMKQNAENVKRLFLEVVPNINFEKCECMEVTSEVQV